MLPPSGRPDVERQSGARPGRRPTRRGLRLAGCVPLAVAARQTVSRAPHAGPIDVRGIVDDGDMTAGNDQPLLWPSADDRQLKAADRQLLEQIAAGELDEHLVAIGDAVNARRELLHTVRSANAMAELCVGDSVMFTSRIRPRYLEHEMAVVEALEDRSVIVRLCRPVGRFRGGTLQCPPLALRRLATPL
jgi:hypothetical protein